MTPTINYVISTVVSSMVRNRVCNTQICEEARLMKGEYLLRSGFDKAHERKVRKIAVVY